MKTEKLISATVAVVVAFSLIMSAGIPLVVHAALPGVSVVSGDITDWWTGEPIDGSLVRLIDTATGEEVGNFTTRADGGYAIAVDFPEVGDTMEAKITASKDGFHTNYTITTLTGLLPPETKTINLVLKEAIAPTVTFVPPTPDNNATVNVSYVFVNVTVDEDETVVDSVWLNFSGVEKTLMKGAENIWFINKTDLTSGIHTYTVYASDVAGNIGMSETRIVHVELPFITVEHGLEVGWNFFSVPLNVDNWTIPAVLEAIDGKYTMVWAFPNATVGSQIYMPGLIEQFTELEPGRGYLIQMNEGVTVQFNGTLLKDLNVGLDMGWNSFAVPYGMVNYSLPGVLSPINGKYTMLWTQLNVTTGSQIYMPPFITDFTELMPGGGYLIQMSESATWSWN